MILFLRLLLIAVFCGIGLGYFLKGDDPTTGHFIIGASLAVGIFVLMPIFIYHRYQGKDLQRYMLNKENIERMRNYQYGKEEEE